MKKTILNVGDIVVSSGPSILETILGSCVSVCLWDERLKIGGMNHFLLPQISTNIKDPAYCGSESIKKLVAETLKLGASTRRLKAKIFGGCRVINGCENTFNVGGQNVRMAKKILNQYEIPIVMDLTGMDYGIKLVFYPVTGRAFVKKIESLPGSV